MNISISICPTSIEWNNGDRYDEAALLAAVRQFALEQYPGATISCLQIGHRQGDEWAKIDGDSTAGEELLERFFAAHGSDEELFAEADPQPVIVELANNDETIRICGGLEDFAGLEHPATASAVRAYRAAAAEALAGDSRASRFDVRVPRGQRILHSQWMGAKFAYQCGAIGVMSTTLTDDEKAAICAADDAGVAAARSVIEAADAAVAE